MSIIGYARVSSIGQSLDVQLDKFAKHGVDRIYQEKVSGANTKDRPELNTMLDYVRDGDKVVITKLDRLGRSVIDLTNIVAKFEEKQVNLVVLDQSLDTSTPAGRLTFHMLASVAEFERSMIRERQMDGISRAKAEGRRLGRKPTISQETIDAVLADVTNTELSKAQVGKKHGISRSKVYQIINEA